METNKINEQSELHERYMKFSITDITILLSAVNRSNHQLHEEITSYNSEITKEELNINELERYKMLLCYRYQTTYYNQTKNQSEINQTDDNLTISDIFPSMETIFPPNRFRSLSQISLLCDIIILQIVLYFDISFSVEYTQNFLCLHEIYFANSNSRIMYMEIVEYLLKFWHLRYDNPDIHDFSSKYVAIMTLCINLDTNSEWLPQTLASIFPKLVDIFPWNDIVYPLWDYVLNNIYDRFDVSIERTITILSTMADVCFLSFDFVSSVQCDIYCKKTFWIVIIGGLTSPTSECRKQALYIMRTAVNSLNESIRSNLITSEYMKAEITPFICNQTDISPSVDCVKEKFFLIYEALEQEQDDLVMPALTHVTFLEEANEKHNICKCFDVTWFQCIFERILKHDSFQIQKWGASYVHKLDEAILVKDFLGPFIETLNNIYFYKYRSDEDCSEILRPYTEFFKLAQKSNLFEIFLKNINEDTIYEPVAMFYIMHAIRILSPEEIHYCAWETDELKVIKLLVKENLSESSSIPCIASQLELLRAIPNYVHEIDDLSLLADVLATFSCLARETDSWKRITTWLSSILSIETATNFIYVTYKKFMRLKSSRQELKTFAMMICLLYDANLIFQQQNSECLAIGSLNNLLHSWNTSFNILKNIDAAEFISHLIDIGTKGGHCEGMLKFISLHIETTFSFLIDKMRIISRKLSFQDYTKYTNIVSSHLNSLTFISAEVTRNTRQSYIKRLQKESINLVKYLKSTVNMQYLYGLHILYLSQEIYPDCLNNYKKDILYILSMSKNIRRDIKVENLRERKITSEYLLLLSRLVYQYLVNNSLKTLGASIGTLLSYLQLFLEIKLPENVPEIAKILRIAIDKFICEEGNEYMKNKEACMFIFKKCFTCIMDNEKDNIFWTAIQSLMEVIINNNFLRSPNAAEFTKTHISYLLKGRIPMSKLNTIIVSKLGHLKVGNMLVSEELLATCLFHGIMHYSAHEVYDQEDLFIIKHLKRDYSENTFTLDYNNCVAIRAETIIMLHKVLSHPVVKDAETFAQHVIHELIQNKNLQLYERLPLYKVQHRQMQTLLIFEPVLNKELILLVYKHLCHFIYTENNHHSSVRLMQEWLLIRILVKNSDLHEELWSLFEKSIKNRPSCMISLASIVYHVAKLLSDDNQKIFIETALPYIERCCFVQQCNARIHNQIILKRLYELMKSTYSDESVSKYKCIYQTAVISLHKNSLESSDKVQDDFYFSHFHPINDYTLQTIFYEFPRLTNMRFDEWISPDVFKMLTFNQNDRHPLRLYNKNPLLSDTKSSVYMTKSFPDLDGMIKEFIGTSDIKLQKGLIIVASLVDQLANLDDIAKMCKTFAIKALIVTNTDCVKNKKLEYLSVSADKWLNMIQVKPHELQKFLLNRKKAGWSLIGIEKTIHSANLMTTTFEEKTVLVLGNEKNGIPVNFIPLLDKCVKISQVNTKCPFSVHFMTTICIYQYIKQMS